MDEGASRWHNTLVGHFVGKKLPFPVVSSIAKKIWDKDGLIQVLAQDHGYYFFRFSSSSDLIQVLDRGPWMFSGRYLALRRWERNLNLSLEPAVSTIPMWV